MQRRPWGIDHQCTVSGLTLNARMIARHIREIDGPFETRAAPPQPPWSQRSNKQCYAKLKHLCGDQRWDQIPDCIKQRDKDLSSVCQVPA